MEKTIGEMLARHEREVKELQANCPHKNKQIHVYVHGPLMHGGGYQDYCEDCGEVLASYQNSMVNGNEERIET